MQSFFKHRLEHGRKVPRRRIDHAQYLGSRRLLLQCLARLGQEPRVFHSDDRLRRKVLQQGYLLVRKRPDLTAVDSKVPQCGIVLTQRHDEQCANAAEIGYSPGDWIAIPVGLARRSIGNLDHALPAHHTLLWLGGPMWPLSEELG